MNNIITSLWVGDKLNSLARLSIKSFLDNGYDFHLYVYNDLPNIPDGCIIKDANSIIPQNQIFYVLNGHHKSLANFSDIWRFTFLYDHGGIWTDLDNVILKRVEFPLLYQSGSPAIMSYPKKYRQLRTILSKIQTDISIIKFRFGHLTSFYLQNFKELKPSNFNYTYHLENFRTIFDLYNGIIKLSNLPKHVYLIHMYNEKVNCYYKNLNLLKHQSLFSELMNKYLPDDNEFIV